MLQTANTYIYTHHSSQRDLPSAAHLYVYNVTFLDIEMRNVVYFIH